MSKELINFSNNVQWLLKLFSVKGLNGLIYRHKESKLFGLCIPKSCYLLNGKGGEKSERGEKK